MGNNQQITIKDLKNISFEEMIKMPEEIFRKLYQEWYKQPRKHFEDSLWKDFFCEKVHFSKRRVVVDRIIKKNHKVICDVGCGSGYLLELIRKTGFKGKLIAFDKKTSDGLSSRARVYGIDICEGDFLKNNSIENFDADAIIFFSSLHYASIAEVENIISRVSSCYDFYIVEPFKEKPENDSLGKVLRMKTKGRNDVFYELELDRAFKEGGFEKKYSHEFPIDTLGRIHTFNHYSKEK